MRHCYSIASEIDLFQAGPGSSEYIQAEAIDEFGWLIRPKSSSADIKSVTGGKDIGLTLMGITHGNEWAGLAVLNHLMALMASGAVQVEFPLACLLGNPWAARENKRFLESDLNRSFAVQDVQTREQKRARSLMPILERTARLVDFHQTTRACDRSFFIFPYMKASYEFARAIGPEQTIVTHWGTPFSAEGQCTDEFVNDRGGVGVSIELGQNGFDPYQIAAGVHIGVRAISSLNEQFTGRIRPRASSAHGPIYIFGEVIDWPAQGLVTLREGLDNFVEIQAGEVLGQVDGKELRAPSPGLMMFAKYLTLEQQKQLSVRPTELCRLLTEIQDVDLPKE